ncbi:kinase-like protein, partial [Heliocybe sulcata]
PSPSKHVILLLDSFSGRTGSWGILPYIPSSLARYLARAPSQLSGHVVQVCWGLIEGLAYLHALCIAHRDIKPDNLLIDRGFCLKIIDFDLALQVRDEDEEVTNYNGTEGWMAPEVEKELPHSPIKADRWSCGHLLLHLLDRLKVDDEILRAAAEKLNVDAPQLRPSLVEWRSWVASPLNAVPGGFPVVPLVRPRPTETDEDHAEGPKAKARRTEDA